MKTDDRDLTPDERQVYLTAFGAMAADNNFPGCLSAKYSKTWRTSVTPARARLCACSA